jgi:hypothetical protein
VTSFTPVYGLPYPDALDAPCDFPEGWCAFTVAVDAVIDRFEIGAQRVIPAIPIAKVTLTEPVTIAAGEFIPWDTVAIDTAGWTNFDADNRVITVSRQARYSVLGAALVGPSGVANSSYVMFIDNVLFSDPDYLDRNIAGVDIGITSQNNSDDITAGTEISMNIIRSGSSGTIPLQSASLTVFWHADEERP